MRIWHHAPDLAHINAMRANTMLETLDMRITVAVIAVRQPAPQ